MILTIDEYFGKWHKFGNSEINENAANLVDAVNRLADYAIADGVEFKINPSTDSVVSGSEYGGFRPQSCTIGAKYSSHKLGLAVDLYDPSNDIDEWCMENQDKLQECGIYIEHPSATNHWSHWTIKSPKSGRRVFYP